MSAGAIRAGQAYVELFTRDGKLVSGLNKAAARLKAFGSAVSGLGARFAGLGLLAGLPFLAAAKGFADFGSDMLDMSQRVGISVEALSELRYAAEQSGASAEDLENAFKFMQKGGFGQSSEDFLRIADDIAGLGSEQERTQRIMEVFGRAGTRLKPLFANGADGVRQLVAEAQRLGLTMSTADAQAAEAFGDQLSKLWAQVKRVWTSIGGALVPALSKLADWLSQVAVGAKDWVEQNRGLVELIGFAVAGVTAFGLALMVLGPAITAIGFAVSGLALALKAFGLAAGVAWLAFSSPIAAVVAGIALVAGGLVALIGRSTGAFATLGQGFAGIASTARTAWGGVMNAIAAGDWSMAGRIALLGLQVAFRQTMNTLSQAWGDFSEFFIGAWDRAVAAVAQAIGGLRQSINMTRNDWAALRQEIRGDAAQAREDQAPLEQRSRELADRIVAERRALAAEQGISYQQAAQRSTVLIDELVRQRAELQRVIAGIGGTLVTPDAGGVNQNQLAAEAAAERQRQRDAANAANQAAVTALQEQLAAASNEAAIARLRNKMAPVFRKIGPGGDNNANQGKTDVSGTFSAFAAAGLGAGSSLVERTARATEQTRDELRGLRRDVAGGGGLPVA